MPDSTTNTGTADIDRGAYWHEFGRVFRVHLPACLVMFIATLWTGWPLWTDFRGLMVSIADPQLNTYLVGWSQFALFNQITSFADANQFWPWESALAYGEHLLAQAVLTLPFKPFLNAVGIHNMSWMQGYFFSALGAYALAWSTWRCRGAALMAGLIYGFAPYRLAQWEHVQLIHGGSLPIMILAFERILKGGGRGWQAILCLAAWGQWLGSWYWTIISFWFLMPYFLARSFQQRSNIDRRVVGRLLAPLLIASIPVAIVAFPYYDLLKTGVMLRPRELAMDWWARPIDFLVSDERNLVFGRGLGFQDRLRSVVDFERYLFPGLSIIAGFIVVSCLRLRKRPNFCKAAGVSSHAVFGTAIPWKPGLWTGITLFMLVLCFGPKFQASICSGSLAFRNPFYDLIDWVPGTDQIRVTARWVLPALLSFAMMLGCAWSSLPDLRHASVRRLVQAGLVILLFLDICWRPLSPVPVDPDHPEVYRWLENQPYPSPILLMPVDHPVLMLEMAWHHQPVVNGSNGYFPRGYPGYMEILSGFPSHASLDKLADFKVRYVVIDVTRTGRDMNRWEEILNRFTAECGLNPFTLNYIGDYLVVDLKPGGNVQGRIENLESVVSEVSAVPR